MNQPKNPPPVSPPMQEVDQLLALYQRGDYEAAEALARALTRQVPQFQFAWKAHGSILKLMNRLEECVAPMQEAVRLDPQDAEAHNNLGDALACLGDYVRAETACREAIRLAPGYALAHNNLGNVLFKLELPQQARAAYAEAIRLEPRFAQAHFNMGHCHELEGHLVEAEASYRQAIRLENGYVEAHTNLGHLLTGQGRLTEAEASCRNAIRLNPANALAHNNLGLVMLKLDHYADAETCFREAIRIDPDLHRAHNNLGNALLNGLQRSEEALASYDRSLELAPGSAEAWTNRGIALSHARRHGEALASHDRAIELEPDSALAWNNRGNTLKDLRRYEEALGSYEQAIRVNPDYADAHYNMGLLQLEKKEFTEGFRNYLQRWETKLFSNPTARSNLPAWCPQLSGKRVLIRGEQGIGDEIFYAGMLPRLLGTGSEFTLAADQRLHEIFKRSFPSLKLVDRGQVDKGAVDTNFDAQAPMGDLGYLLQFDPTKSEYVRQPFLFSDPAKSAEFKADHHFGSGKLVCGISWRSAHKEWGADKSIRLADLDLVLSNSSLSFVNLQYGDVNAEISEFSALGNRHIHQFKGLDPYQDIDGLLSLMNACDLVITTSNVTAHLAGAIGKKGCVIVPFAKGRVWYWHLDDVVSTWYPSLRVFYQDDPTSWSGTIKKVAEWVEDCC